MTMSKSEKHLFAWGAIGILIFIALWLWARSQQASSVPIAGTPSASQAPTLYSTTPGFPDIGIVYYGQPSPVNTLATLSFNENLPAFVSNQYLPLFGLVGFGQAPGYQ
jgi:hypothetical protein